MVGRGEGRDDREDDDLAEVEGGQPRLVGEPDHDRPEVERRAVEGDRGTEREAEAHDAAVVPEPVPYKGGG